ncbi:MAG: pyruvate, phosphate dikinase [Proteobacteria bacterium]|nr:pyruvate, phosphate dikinase [Pseudomonadota bacterium]NOG59601.1 pyruvate, phosphate dikinase [Pseudomonadota bacterium]
MQTKNKKRIYYFSKELTEGNKSMRELLGGKGANLAEMTSIGLPVPPGFTITTATCAEYHEDGEKLPAGLLNSVHKNMSRLEKESGKCFGSSQNPLLVSVRSGAAASMPGMMDTVLNLGLNDLSVEGLASMTGNERFALDAYRRLINMFGDVVMGIDHHYFEAAFDKIKKRYKVSRDTELNIQGLRELVTAYKQIYKTHTRKNFPQDPYKQLQLAIEAVFRSWNIPRAITYRRINEIQGLIGTAVNVQSMVFGNMGDDSGTGVAFTRDPSTGKNEFYGEFLINAQGEDVVAGIRTPSPVKEMKKWRPDIHQQLLKVKKILESHYKDMQDIEFTIERGNLFMLQTRVGKRTGPAAVKIAVDMVKEKSITQKTALLRVPANDLNQLLLPSFDPKAKRRVLTVGLPASPGAASGYPVFTADEAVVRAENGENVILVRRETSPEDVHGMHVASGILTSTGGSTSHAAVVARGWGKCCVAGAGELVIDAKRKKIQINGTTITGKDIISIDGTSGELMLGDVAKCPPNFSKEFKTLMNWADKKRKLLIRTNADSPEDAKVARDFGAEGIGLCRTEHMFFGDQRIVAMRQMILADNEQDRRLALKKILPYQRKDFEGIFTAMKELPVTIRLLDPPLHEFLPQDQKTQKQLARSLKVPVEKIIKRVSQLHEVNPMLGHRGCRLSITYPEILEMQVRAITEATINCRRKRINAFPEIMIPLVGIVNELAVLRSLVEQTIAKVKSKKKYNGKLDIPIGTMIEIPRAALTAEQVAAYADFFSFGTNDLTQMTFGYSRDDIGTFIPEYLKENILEKNPFQSMDSAGVGQLVEMAVNKGRKIKSKLKCGICGEHGGDPESIAFFQSVQLNYVSCSPFRIPVARLAAAQAVLLEQ